MGITFSTEVRINSSSFDLTGQSPVMMIGSCFSDHIGGYLSKYKFNILKNPFGVLYNPSSIAQALKLVIENTEITRDELVFHNNIWHSFFFHSSFSDTDIDKTLEKTNRAIADAHQFLKTARFLFITFGTAWVYRHIAYGRVVSNCHKLPASEFKRYRLSVDEVTDEWELLISQVSDFNPDLRLIFTVSPIRHLKDGAHENQLSKAVLFLSIDKLLGLYKQFEYFPSYEIVHDELRDYRFYADDLVHITDKAVAYLFEKFKRTYLNAETIEYINDIESIVLAAQHRILNKNVDETKKFAKTMLKKINSLEKKYPFVNFQLEKNHFENL